MLLAGIWMTLNPADPDRFILLNLIRLSIMSVQHTDTAVGTTEERAQQKSVLPAGLAKNAEQHIFVRIELPVLSGFLTDQ